MEAVEVMEMEGDATEKMEMEDECGRQMQMGEYCSGEGNQECKEGNIVSKI